VKSIPLELRLAPPGAVLMVQEFPAQSVRLDVPVPMRVAWTCSRTDCANIVCVLSTLLRLFVAIVVDTRPMMPRAQIIRIRLESNTSITDIPESDLFLVSIIGFPANNDETASHAIVLPHLPNRVDSELNQANRCPAFQIVTNYPGRFTPPPQLPKRSYRQTSEEFLNVDEAAQEASITHDYATPENANVAKISSLNGLSLVQDAGFTPIDLLWLVTTTTPTT
jgi:hypothetical protein